MTLSLEKVARQMDKTNEELDKALEKLMKLNDEFAASLKEEK